MRVDDERLVVLTAAGLAGVAAGLLVVPGLIGRLWFGVDDATSRALLRLLGARDLTLAAGMAAASRRDRPVRGWLGATAAVAAADGLVSAARWRDLPWTGRVIGVGGSTVAAVGAAVLARAATSG